MLDGVVCTSVTVGEPSQVDQVKWTVPARAVDESPRRAGARRRRERIF